MTVHRQFRRLPHVPWGAVGGELVTSFCFVALGLFLPPGHWASWPQLLFNWHIMVIVVGAFGLAVALLQRRPTSVKVAVVLAAYTGLPSLLTLDQAISSAHSAAEGLSFVLLGFGMLGQVLVLWSCLVRLTPSQ